MTWEPVQDVCRELGWPPPQWVAETESTNSDLRHRDGDGLVLVADRQTAGRGRSGRAWVSRPGDGLTFSIRRTVPTVVTDWGWIPLLHGVAVVEGIAEAAGVETVLKWPNDVLLGSGKVAGLLVERDGDGAVVGVGLNIRFAGELPDPGAACLADGGPPPDAGVVLAAILVAADRWWNRWVAAGGDAARSGVAQRYRDLCHTLGAEVTVTAPDGQSWSGLARDVDTDGALVVQAGEQRRRVLAGDVAGVRAD